MLYSDESTFQLVSGKNGFWVLSPKNQRDHPDFISGRSKSKRLSWYGGAAWVTGICVWRYYWHGGIYWDCTETYTAIKMMSFMGSPWLLYQDNASSHSACATTAWFRRLRVNVLDRPACSPDLTPTENVWPVMKRRIRQRQSQTAEHLKSCIKWDWTKILHAKL